MLKTSRPASLFRSAVLQFGYFRVERESVLFSGEFQLDDIIVNGKASLFDRSEFYQLDYAYALFRDDRSRVLFTVGLYGLDLKYTFEAQGEIRQGNTVRSGGVKEESSVFAPLPLFGLNFWYAYTPKWSINTKVSLVGGSFNDISALVVQTSVNSIYQFNRRVGGVFGITYFNAAVTIEDETNKDEVDYAYGGVFLGIHATF